MAGKHSLTKEFLAERDLRIFAMRKAGVPVQDISRRFQMTTPAVNAAIRRQLERLNREAVASYPEVLRMELERLDALQQSIWPLTQHRKVTMDDGTEVSVEPDIKAIQQVLNIMDRRSKLLGLDQNNINMTVDHGSTGGTEPRAVLAGAINGPADSNAFNPEVEARQLLELMGRSGVLPPEAVNDILGVQPALPMPASLSADEPLEGALNDE